MTTPYEPRDISQLTDDEVDEAFGQLRNAVEQAPAAARNEVVESPELIAKVVKIVDERFRRRHFRTIIAAVGLLLLFFVGAGWFALDKLGGLDATNVLQDASIERSEQTIAAFRQQLDAANASLIAQGLPPILAPGDAAPGTPEQAQLISAAGAATALDKIARQDKVAPGTGADSKAVARIVAEQVSAFMAVNPVTVPPDEIFQQVAAYASANQERLRGAEGVAGAPGLPGAPGAPGDPGAPGPPVSAEQIRSAFAEEVQRNPNTLCPVGGSYGARQLALAGGGSTTQYGCFNGDQDAPAEPPASSGGEETGGGASEAPAPSEGADPTN